MSFDKTTRNALAKLVSDCRRLLTADIRDQLQRIYGLQPDGTALPIWNLQHLDEQGLEIARELRIWQDHLASTEHGADQRRRIAAFDRLAQETAFTALNRLAALRLCEERGHLLECVRRGKESDGFALYERLSGGALGTRGDTYHQFLQRVFDELAQDLGVLFDRRQPQSLVFPGERCLEEVLTLMNDPALRHLWQEDETIGWIYQYYNSQEERRQMREESAAPRNSRELAVRNQFFTPRYVVEFLTDNTLGRIWYEMTKGSTLLKEKCRYLVRRPNELFLGPGEDPLTSNHEEQTSNRSQEELLKESVHIPHRSLKDPREIRLLDPACGSMHFGLYAFDLFEVIYEEVWDKHPELLADLRRAITDKREFLIRVPKLIIEHNLHGIEIDARCTQIAGLSLWLRAQKTWQRLGLRMAERPRIARSNIVCAEPMPGEKELLREFTARLESPAIGQLVEMVFDKMELAGEAGSLLKIEEEIKLIVAEAKALWKQGPKYEQAKLFGDFPAKPEQQSLKLDLSAITDEQFWEKAEERIYMLLSDYAKEAQNGGVYQRRLFAEDAARGFAFVDLCRKRYEVVVMNPPFGEPSRLGKIYIDKVYAQSSADILQAFVDRGLEMLCAKGRVGVISARTGFFLGDSKQWRKNVVFANRLITFADLGLGVLDDALVEVAAYVVEQGDAANNVVFTNRQLDTREKDRGLLESIIRTAEGKCSGIGFFLQSLIDIIPDHVFAYWAPSALLKRYEAANRFGNKVGRVRQGVATADDFRFARLSWEVPSNCIGKGRRWQRFSKGGEYSPPYDDIHLLIDWLNNGAQLKASENARFQNIESMFLPGATYTVRTASAFAGKVLPAGCVFSHNAQSWFTDSTDLTLLSIGYLSCRVPQTFLELAVGSGDIATAGSAARRYTTAVVEGVPAGPLAKLNTSANLQAVKNLYYYRLSELIRDETSCHFSDFHLNGNAKSLRRAAESWTKERVAAAVVALRHSSVLDGSVTDAFDLSDEERAFVDQEVGVHPAHYRGLADRSEVVRLYHLSQEQLIAEAIARHGSKRWFTKKSYYVDRSIEIICHLLGISPSTFEEQLSHGPLTIDLEELAARVVSEVLGCAFGRWDIELAAGKNPTPGLPEPFAPLSVCPPGMLQTAEGLPATPADVSMTYPLRVSWSGILVDDPNNIGDIERRAREVIEVIWKELAEDIEHECCEILAVKALRDYFRKPTGFFADHLKRYAKSRRQAPIYWPLSTASGSYTIWVYYHRLNEDFLYKVVNDYVAPKLIEVERRLLQIEADLERASGREATKLRERFEETKSFIGELQDFKAELLRVAALPYKPNLNDGVLITAAPLWKLFRLPKWRNDLKECWEKLEAGDFDWAHLAHSIWPDRVREKCKKDRSLAIAHGSEHLCETTPQQPNSGQRRKRKAKVAAPAES